MKVIINLTILKLEMIQKNYNYQEPNLFNKVMKNLNKKNLGDVKHLIINPEGKVKKKRKNNNRIV